MESPIYSKTPPGSLPNSNADEGESPHPDSDPEDQQQVGSPGFLTVFLPTIVGGVLLLASALKSHQILTEPAVSSRSPVVVLIGVEMLVGLALILGTYPWTLRWIALALFAGFFVTSIYKLHSGASSCGCLGSVEITPSLVMVLDLGVLIALWFWKPIPSPQTSSPRLILLLALLSAGGAFLLAWKEASFPYPRLVVPSPVVNLGSVTSGSEHEFELVLRNTHAQQIVVSRLEVSCSCLTATGSPWIVPPKQEHTVRFHLDLGKEPQFAGQLLIEIQGHVPTGEAAFAAQVQVRVVKSKELAHRLQGEDRLQAQTRGRR